MIPRVPSESAREATGWPSRSLRRGGEIASPATNGSGSRMVQRVTRRRIILLGFFDDGGVADLHVGFAAVFFAQEDGEFGILAKVGGGSFEHEVHE